MLHFKLDKLEEQIDIYWCQRAHTKWLKEGDRNTNFFHASCSEQRRRNCIGRISNGQGGWIEDEGEKQEFINIFLATFQVFCLGGCAATSTSCSSLCDSSYE